MSAYRLCNPLAPTRGRYLLFAALALLLISAGEARGQRPEPLAANSTEIEVLPVQGRVQMIATGGSNIAVQVGDVGAVIVDSGNAEVTEQVVAAVRKLSALPPRYLINTSGLPGHVSGNAAVAAIGAPIPGNPKYLGMPIISHQNAATRLAEGALGPLPSELWPFDTFFGPKKTIYLNGEGIEILHLPAAITDGDVMVYFHGSDVLATGDIYATTQYPHFRPELGGSLQGVIDALNRIIDTTIPKFNQQGGTLIIPGHGRISSESDVVEYRDMVTIIRDRIASMVGEGKSFEEVLGARPSLEYDGLYGSLEGPWTTRMFLKAVYDDVVHSTDEP